MRSHHLMSKPHLAPLNAAPLGAARRVLPRSPGTGRLPICARHACGVPRSADKMLESRCALIVLYPHENIGTPQAVVLLFAHFAPAGYISGTGTNSQASIEP